MCYPPLLKYTYVIVIINIIFCTAIASISTHVSAKGSFVDPYEIDQCNQFPAPNGSIILYSRSKTDSELYMQHAFRKMTINLLSVGTPYISTKCCFETRCEYPSIVGYTEDGERVVYWSQSTWNPEPDSVSESPELNIFNYLFHPLAKQFSKHIISTDFDHHDKLDVRKHVGDTDTVYVAVFQKENALQDIAEFRKRIGKLDPVKHKDRCFVAAISNAHPENRRFLSYLGHIHKNTGMPPASYYSILKDFNGNGSPFIANYASLDQMLKSIS